MLKSYFKDFIYFGFKQAYACIFGGLLVAGIVLSKFLWPADFILTRYDFLFLYAILIQALLILFKLETWEEVRVIFVFHVIGTIMEIFKTHMGSWIYPEDNLLRIGGVPLFSGFMYASIGSYLARAWRIFKLNFTHYPAKRWAALLCLLIYINFFTHHYTIDIRLFLFILCGILYSRTFVFFTPREHTYKMPMLVGFLLVSFFIWIAENAGTFSATWTYPSQHSQWDIVPFEKLGSWFLLMIISFVLVSLLHKEKSQA